MSKIKLFADETLSKVESKVNQFLETRSEDSIISIQYSTTPTAIAAHSEYGVYPSVEYSVLIQYK